ncbi:hypothetical protein AB6805_28780 [Chitinophaga sp. RCC_12]|uniref:hypothetical protein n=1 Tax=Chitinophaga sp. RCC_12 TaxID=3239226 RepID=UPI003525A462
MAKQTGLLRFTGKLGNIIGYRRNGNYFVRTMPEAVRQTAATRKASRNFGVASRKGKLIRRAIIPQLHIHHDGALVNRLNKALIQTSSDSLRGLEGFRVNRYTGTEQFFPHPPVVSQQGLLKIPAQSLPPQGEASHLEVTVTAVRICFRERRITGRSSTTVMLDLHQPFNGLELEANTPGKGTLLIILQVRSFNGTIATGNRRFFAADIVAVMAPAATKQKRLKAGSIPDVRKRWSLQPEPIRISRRPQHPAAQRQRE